MRGRVKWICITVICLILLLPRPFIILRDFHSRVTYAEIPILPTTRFTVEWIHSVELTPWRETYLANWPEGITLTETAFRSYGAGVPADTGKQTKVVDGWIVASGLSESRENVIYLISKPDYKLMIEDRIIPLTQLLPRYTSMEMTAKWRFWWWNLVRSWS
jgi:hypothetical protein